MDRLVSISGAAATIIVAAMVLTAIWWAFYFLWSAVAVGVFGLPEMTFWQSVGALFLISILGNIFRSLR